MCILFFRRAAVCQQYQIENTVSECPVLLSYVELNYAYDLPLWVAFLPVFAGETMYSLFDFCFKPVIYHGDLDVCLSQDFSVNTFNNSSLIRCVYI